MPETATMMAALRARQVDYVGTGGHLISSFDQALSLKRTNPEIVQWNVFGRSDHSYGMNVTKPPFDDLRVRKAMQMALDNEIFNITYLRGSGVSTPHGWVNVPGYFIPFAEWPAELKKVFDYDPEGAEALLDEAGYPRGADGIRFKTTVNHYQPFGLNYIQTAVEFWKAIGVDVEIVEMDGTALGALKRGGTFEGMITSILAVDWSPPNAIQQSHSTAPGNSIGGLMDPVYDAMVEAAASAATLEEQQRLVGEADMYAIERHWYIWGPMAPWVLAHQPWVKGYNGEFDLGSVSYGLVFARLWIDQELKDRSQW